MSLWLNTMGVSSANPLTVVTGQETPWMLLPGNPDPIAQSTMQRYLTLLSGKGMDPTRQGVWMQSGPSLLANNSGTTPLPAASLTKVATSLAALYTWGPDFQFQTVLSATGPIENGVLQGDLVVQGNGDPVMVWEEAIALGNDLNRLGITKVAGNLVVSNNFLMNFEPNPLKAGEQFRQALNFTKWSDDAEEQYRTLPAGTPKPQVTIAGTVQVLNPSTIVSPKQVELIRHRSLPISQIVKLMNIYSNNIIAESLANTLGGAPVVARTAAQVAGVSEQEIVLQNGSGLGVENQISPHAICAMFASLQRYLQAHNLTIADLFPIAGRDKGTIEERNLPAATVVKTGTLNDVSALAGVLPTRDRGLVWFVIQNRGTDLEDLRHQQDALLQAIVQQWGLAAPPIALTPTTSIHSVAGIVGDTQRNQVVRSAVETNWLRQN